MYYTKKFRMEAIKNVYQIMENDKCNMETAAKLVAKTLQIPHGTILSWYYKSKIPEQKVPYATIRMTDDLKNEIVTRIDEGYTAEYLKMHYGISYGQLHKLLHEIHICNLSQTELENRTTYRAAKYWLEHRKIAKKEVANKYQVDPEGMRAYIRLITNNMPYRGIDTTNCKNENGPKYTLSKRKHKSNSL